MTDTSTIIAVDPGFGNTKAYSNGKLVVIPSIVARPKAFGAAGMGLRKAISFTDVEFEGNRFALGTSAIEWGTPVESMDYLSFVSPEKRALLYGVLAGILDSTVSTIGSLIIGLPVQLLKDEIQAEQILNSLRALKGKHNFALNQKPFEICIDRLKVMPQPLGTYADWLLNEELYPRHNAYHGEVAIIDIGMNTLDLYALQAGRPEPRFVAGSKNGVRRLFDILNQDGSDMSDIDISFRNGKLKPSEQAMQSWLGEIVAQIELVMPKLSRFSAVIPTGGGSVILSDHLRYALIKKGAAVVWPEDPISSNVRGLWKWGVYGARR